MQNISAIEFHTGSREELLPGFEPDFPYIASQAELDKYPGRYVPWHWHRTVELFYMKSGALEYHTPNEKILFPAGSGGMANSNVLHMTKVHGNAEKNSQLLHIFDVSLLAGEPGSRIGQTYITPIAAAPQIEILPLFPEDPAQNAVLKRILDAFRLPVHEFEYEIRLRNALSEIWLMLFEQSRPLLAETRNSGKNNDKIKQMIIYIHEHYSEKITVQDVAASAFLSERECYRVFRGSLHTTPVEYIKSCRLQAACRMLAESQEPVTMIGQACGLGSSSYFGKVFREYAHCTPSEYRAKWQDCDR